MPVEKKHQRANMSDTQFRVDYNIYNRPTYITRVHHDGRDVKGRHLVARAAVDVEVVLQSAVDVGRDHLHVVVTV